MNFHANIELNIGLKTTFRHLFDTLSPSMDEDLKIILENPIYIATGIPDFDRVLDSCISTEYSLEHHKEEIIKKEILDTPIFIAVGTLKQYLLPFSSTITLDQDDCQDLIKKYSDMIQEYAEFLSLTSYVICQFTYVFTTMCRGPIRVPAVPRACSRHD